MTECVIEPASGGVFVVPYFPENLQGPSAAISAPLSPLAGNFANADFHGWFRYPDSGAEPRSEGDFVSRNIPLVTTEDGFSRGVLVNDWDFAWKATFRCPAGGSGENWQMVLDGPIVVGGGFLVIRHMQVNVAFDAACNFSVLVNGVLFRQVPGTPGLPAEVIAVAPLDRCEQGFLGRPWSFTLFHDGTQELLPEAEMTAHPEVRSAGGEIRIEADPLSIRPELPDELTLPHGSTPDFDDRGAPGGRSTITVTALDVACRAGLAGIAPVDVPLPGADFDIALANVAQSGGHTHAPPSRTFPPPPVSPFFKTSLGAAQTLLNDIDPATVTPPTANPGFDAFSGHLLGRAAAQGLLAFAVEAGQVSGIVDVSATAAPSSPILVPGAVIAPGAPLAVFVEVPGLVPLAVNPGLYHLSGNRFSGPGFFGAPGENHDQNHFVAPGMQGHIDGIAAEFKINFPASSGLFGAHDFYLAIDDASLETGGLFDIDAMTRATVDPRIRSALAFAVALLAAPLPGDAQSTSCSTDRPDIRDGVLDVTVTKVGTDYRYDYGVRNASSSLGCIGLAIVYVTTAHPTDPDQVIAGQGVRRMQTPPRPGFNLVPGTYFADAPAIKQCSASVGGLGLVWGCSDAMDPDTGQFIDAPSVLPGNDRPVFSILSPFPPGPRAYELEPDYDAPDETWDPNVFQDATIRAQTLGPTHPDDLVLFPGDGAESPAVNDLLAYSNPISNVVRLRRTETNFPLAIRYAAGIASQSFTASLDGVDITSAFRPSPDTMEAVIVPLSPGSHTLVLSVAGLGATDSDRFVFLVGDQTPVAAPDAVLVAEDGSVTSDVLANDAGLGEVPLSLTIAVSPGNGTVTVNADRTITYAPAPNFFGADTYSYTVTDADGDSSTAAVSVTVGSVNDPPSALDAFSPAVIGVPIEIALAGSDVDHCDLTFSIVAAPTLGTLSAISALPCTPGTPNADRATVAYTATATGADSFTFRVQDADGAFADAVVEIFVTPPGAARLGVHTEAQTTFGPDAAETLDDASCTSSPCVLTSLSESSGSSGAFVSTSMAFARASRGSLATSAAGSGTVLYSSLGSAFFALPDVVFIGPDATVCGVELNLHLDGLLSFTSSRAGRAIAELTVHADVGGNAFDGTLAFLNGFYLSSTGLLFDVTDSADLSDLSLTTPGFCVPTGQPVLLTLSLAASVDEIGDDSFRDSSLEFSSTLSFPETGPVFELPPGFTADAPSAGIIDNHVTGEPTNHVPVAAPDTVLVPEDGSVTSVVLANDSGLEDVPLSLSIAVAPENGSVLVNANLTITYAPTPGFFGTDTYSYTVTDADGESSTASVAVTVSSVDDTPVAAPDAVLVAEDAVVTSDVLANDTGFGDGLSSLTLAVAPAHGSATVNPNRTITYAPAPDFFGADTYSYTVTDVDGDSSTAAVSVTVTPVNDPPSALGASSAGVVGVPVEIALVGTDVDDCELTFSIVVAPTFGTLGVPAAQPCTPGAPSSDRATVTYTASATHFDSLIFRVKDAAGASSDAEVSIAAFVVTTPTPTNRAPDCSAAAATPTSLWSPNHTLVPISIVGVTDADGDPVTLSTTGVRQDEAVREEGAGAGSSEPDATLLPLAVRAERNGNPKTPGDGRVYHIAFSAFDGHGGSCSGSVTVCVPHDLRPGATCLDGGAVFDSLVP